jgi:hypothetical protein
MAWSAWQLQKASSKNLPLIPIATNCHTSAIVGLDFWRHAKTILEGLQYSRTQRPERRRMTMEIPNSPSADSDETSSSKICEVPTRSHRRYVKNFSNFVYTQVSILQKTNNAKARPFPKSSQDHLRQFIARCLLHQSHSGTGQQPGQLSRCQSLILLLTECQTFIIVTFLAS